MKVRKPFIKKSIRWRNFSIIKRKRIITYALYRKLALYKYSDNISQNIGLFILKNMIKDFKISSNFKYVNYNIKGFGFFFYKNLRELQIFIKSLRFKIVDVHNLKLLKNISKDLFINSWNRVKFWHPLEYSTLFDQKVKSMFSKDETSFDLFFKIKKYFGFTLNLPKEFANDFNLYLFQFYLKLYELEEILQWFNWIWFRSDVESVPYKYNKPKDLIFFFKDIRLCGYDSWYKKRFNRVNFVYSNKFKLKKKWRFWREFKKHLLFDKTHVFMKFKWLHNHKRVLNHQYFKSYSIKMQSKLKQMYKRKISKARLFSYLCTLEYRLDILTMRLFKIKSIKWAWILLHFGYLTVNLKKKKRNYILQLEDMFFGWFLLKNLKLIRRLCVKFHKSRLLSSFLEYEPWANTFICLSVAIKYSNQTSKDDRLISKKFIKYTYLKTY